MAFRTRRQQRYIKLRESGFLPFEAQDLSKVSIKLTPYLQQMVTERKRMLAKATKARLTKAGYKKLIDNIYDKGHFYIARAQGIKPDVWKMFRDWEEKYRDKHPEYQSPWQKKRKKWVDFMAKAERTIAKQNVRLK